MRRNYLFGLLIFTQLLSLIASENASAGNGSVNSNGFWGNPSSWLFSGAARVPTCGDSVTIQAGATITVNSQQTYNCGSPLYVFISGTLQFTTGNKLTLPCGSIIKVNPGGVVIPGGGGGNSNYINICNSILWNSGSGNLVGPVVLQQSPLPIELLYFTGTDNKETVVLQWATATEINNDFFTLERSLDAIEWTEIGHVIGAGNSSTMIEYSFVDQQPVSGISYYRLKQTDYDGTFTYSDPIAVNMNGSIKNTLVSAALDQSDVRVDYLAAENGEAIVTIYNMSGTEEFRTNVRLNKGTNSLRLSTPFLSGGIHFISVEFGADRQSMKAGMY